MTGTRIPPHVVDRAIMFARINEKEESCGFFFIEPGKLHVEPAVNAQLMESDSWGERHPYVGYHLAPNMAKDPTVGSEVPAEWLAHKIVDQGMTPLAMFHSHPSGVGHPSPDDFEFFPEQYVNWSLLWTRSEAKSIYLYNKFGEVRHSLSYGVVIPDAGF